MTRSWEWSFRANLTSPCPGLRPGWFLLGDEEIWYSRRHCKARIWLLRSMYVGVCRDCSKAFDRRGFRASYTTPRGELLKDAASWSAWALPTIAGLVFVIMSRLAS